MFLQTQMLLSQMCSFVTLSGSKPKPSEGNWVEETEGNPRVESFSKWLSGPIERLISQSLSTSFSISVDPARSISLLCKPRVVVARALQKRRIAIK